MNFNAIEIVEDPVKANVKAPNVHICGKLAQYNKSTDEFNIFCLGTNCASKVSGAAFQKAKSGTDIVCKYCGSHYNYNFLNNVRELITNASIEPTLTHMVKSCSDSEIPYQAVSVNNNIVVFCISYKYCIPCNNVKVFVSRSKSNNQMYTRCACQIRCYEPLSGNKEFMMSFSDDQQRILYKD